MNCFGFAFGYQMNSACAAASCDGSCAARTSSANSVNMILAGIAAAVSVLFISALLSLRLSLGLLGLILLIAIIVSIIMVISVLLVRNFPERRKR